LFFGFTFTHIFPQVRIADRIAPCGSTQRNENCNQVVASKHPKNRHYAASESLLSRVSAAVGQINEGTKYIVDVNKKLKLSPGSETTKFRDKKDKVRSGRAEVQGTKEAKKKRLLNKRNQNRKNAGQEVREGISYQTDCGLDGIADLLHDPSG